MIAGKTLELALSILDKLLDKIPDYDDRKIKNYYKIKDKFRKEVNRPYSERDDDLILDLRDELIDQMFLTNREIK